jgi:hypothetical protein
MVGISTKAYDLPVSVEAAAWRADYAVRRDKSDPIQITASGDKHPTIAFFRTDGTVDSYTFIDGAFRKYEVVS